MEIFSNGSFCRKKFPSPKKKEKTQLHEFKLTITTDNDDIIEYSEAMYNDDRYYTIYTLSS